MEKYYFCGTFTAMVTTDKNEYQFWRGGGLFCKYYVKSRQLAGVPEYLNAYDVRELYNLVTKMENDFLTPVGSEKGRPL